MMADAVFDLKNLAHNFGFAFTVPSCRRMLPYDPQVTSRGFNTRILCAFINNSPMFTLTRQICRDLDDCSLFDM